MTIHVTQEDIDEGCVGENPLERAVRRTMREQGIKIERNFLVVDDTHLCLWAENYRLPVQVRKWIAAYDTNDDVAPITFEIEMEES